MDKILVHPRLQDITVDIKEHPTDHHIVGNAYQKSTVEQLQKTLNGKKIGAIIFERIAPFPLECTTFFRQLCKGDVKNLKCPQCLSEPYKLDQETFNHLKIGTGYAATRLDPIYPIPYDKRSILNWNPNIDDPSIMQFYIDLMAPNGQCIFITSSSSPFENFLYFCSVCKNNTKQGEYKLVHPFENLDQLHQAYKAVLQQHFTAIQFHTDPFYVGRNLFISMRKNDHFFGHCGPSIFYITSFSSSSYSSIKGILLN